MRQGALFLDWPGVTHRKPESGMKQCAGKASVARVVGWVADDNRIMFGVMDYGNIEQAAAP